MDNNSKLKGADTLSAEIDNIVMLLSTVSADNMAEYSAACITSLQQVDIAAKNSDYSEVLKASQWCQQNLTLFKQNQTNQIEPFVESGECWSWIELISASLADPEETYESDLRAELLRDEWLKPYDQDDLEKLVSQLKQPQVASDNSTNDSSHSQSNQAVSSSNSSLTFTWDEDIHPEFLEAFFEETTDLVDQLTTLLVKVSNRELDSEARYNASRIAHTIKGGSAVANITALTKLSYRFEKILDYSVKHELEDNIHSLLADSSQCLQDLFQAIKEKTGEPQSFAAVYNQLTEYAESLEEDNEPLTLGKPNLPDFITQQTSSEPASKETPDTLSDSANANTDSNPDIDITDIDITDNDSADPCAELDEIIMTLSTINTTDTTDCARYIDELQYLYSWAEVSDYSEIAKTVQWCQQNFAQFNDNPQNQSTFIESGNVWLWLELISASLSDPEEPSHLAELTSELMRKEWVIPFEMDNLQKLLMQLKTSDGNEDVDSNSDAEVTESDSDSYKFSWDDDIHPELLSSYLAETPDQISQVATLLIKISKGEANKADHQQASRIAHTIKGASGVVGISALVEFTHRLEDILDFSINHPLPEEISNLLADSSDCLEDTFDAIHNKEDAPEEFEPLLSKLKEYSETLDKDDLIDESLLTSAAPELPDFISNNQVDESLNSQIINPVSSITKPDRPDGIDTLASIPSMKAFETTNLATPTSIQEPDFSAFVNASENIKVSIENESQQETSDTENFIRVPVNIIDKLLNLVGELVTTSTQVADKIDKSIDTSKQIKDQDRQVHKMLEELDSTLSKQEKEQFKVISSLQDSNFDNLEMDTYNELHSISGLLTESILDAEAIEANLERQLHGLKDDLHTLDLLNKDLSEVILSSRMVSINSLVPRLERIVRQTSKKTKKRAELIVTGNEINIDTDILNGLTDPLLHLLRNAIDHGIEYPADRQTKKKQKIGQIKLEFSRQGNHIQMQLKDDGAGIDAEKIYKKAIEKGLITSDQKLSKNEKLQLILHAGFSTQENVTDISGRGVGMDVVNSAVHALNGTLRIESEINEGTTFTINIPLTLVTSATLLVNVSDRQVAIPSESIEQLHYLSPDMIIEREQGYFVHHENTELPIQSLASLIGFPVTTPDFTKSHTLLFINNSNKTHAIYVDEIISSRQAVVKNLSDWLNTSNGLIGACHLSDGGVAPVINLPQVLSLNEKTNQTIKQIQLNSDNQIVEDRVAKILVVDDSLSNRKALSLIIEQTEYDVMTAVDGLDALQIMNENQIDLVFTDLEMPRMNGIELTQAIRAWNDKKEIPVVMITSRTTSKHRQLAEKAGVDDYLTKPVVTETLLSSIQQWLEKAVA